MNVIYKSDNSKPILLPLELLIRKFDNSGGWYDHMSAEHMRDELESRGYCEGLHRTGHYLVIDPAKLGCIPLPELQDACDGLPKADSSVRDIMLANGYGIAWTGGGCRAWSKDGRDGTYFWICDADGTGLGDSVSETYLVGHYDSAGDLLAESTCADLHCALAWCMQ